jgi:hypothetical protein
MESHKETPVSNKQKCHFLFLLQNWRTRVWNRSLLGGRVGTGGRREELRKGMGG